MTYPLVRMKFIADEKLMYGANESAELDDRDLPRYIRITDLNSEGNLKEDTFKSLEWEKARPYLLRKGDILFARSGATVGKAYIHETDEPACYAGYLIKLKVDLKKCLPKFVFYYTQTNKYTAWIAENTIQATIQNVSAEKYANLFLPLPSLKLQEIIIKYLENNVAHIDGLIAKKIKYIDLLEQQRQSIITETVTKGLNPNVKMKDSGVEGIGKIPEHWEEQKIKYLFYESNERNFNKDAMLLSLFTSIGVKPRSEMEEKGNKAQTVINYKVVRKGDIVVNKLLAWMGAIGLSEYNGVTSPDYDVYRPLNSARIDELYYHYYFRNHYFKGDCFKFGRGIMMMRWRTYPEQLKSILVPVPPKEEQTQIANYIEKKEKELALTIKNIEHSIQKLKEYRQFLIYEAVTGKIDVREMEREVSEVSKDGCGYVREGI